MKVVEKVQTKKEMYEEQEQKRSKTKFRRNNIV